MRLAFGNHWATAVFYGALTVWMVLEVRTARHSRSGRGRGPDLDRGSRRFIIAGYAAGVLLAVVVAAVVPAAALPGPRWWPVWTGITLLLGGLALRMWAIHTLGAWFTYDVRIQHGQRVVTSGPYRLLRHPSYTGALLCSAGVGLALGNGLAVLMAVLVPLAGVLHRIRVEEEGLLGELGAEYATYCRTTKRLIPGVW